MDIDRNNILGRRVVFLLIVLSIILAIWMLGGANGDPGTLIASGVIGYILGLFSETLE